MLRVVILLGGLLLLGGPACAAEVSFARDIRPILSDACFACHGPDAKKRKADFRLDTEHGAFAALSSGGKAFSPGKLAISEAYQRLIAKDKRRMPPAKAARQLTSDEIDLLRRWIEQGAKWQKHWAFLPPRKSPVPHVKSSQLLRTPIDAFILARLEKVGLTFSPEADRATLLRRVTLDLTGLPPTPAEVDAFTSDRGPGAYERAVDRLLASPRLGERLAIRWIDAARYADTSGYQNDGERIMWRWRDGVIEAFNANQPFDAFTVEQLAGDLLPHATLDQVIASGFNRNHRGNAEGGIIPAEYAAEYVADRVETTSTVWLGLTVGCARCHDHKFDPITTKEFYQLFALFNNVPERGKAVKFGNSPPLVLSPTRWQKEQLAKLDEGIAAVLSQVNALEPKLQEEIRSSGAHSITGSGNGYQPKGLTNRFANGGKLSPDNKACFRDGKPAYVPGKVGEGIAFDGKGYVEAKDAGAFTYLDRFSLAAWVYPEKTKQGTIVSKMTDVSEGDGYSVRLHDGRVQVNLVKRWLDDAIRIESDEVLTAKRWRHVLVVYDGSRTAAGVRLYLDGKPAIMRVLLDDLNQTFEVKEPFRIGAGNGPLDRFFGRLNDVAIFDRDLDDAEARIAAVSEGDREISRIPIDKRTGPQAEKFRRFFIEACVSAPIRVAHHRLAALKEQRRKLLDTIPTTMVMQEMPKPRETHILLRGQYDKPGAKVTPAVPAVLSAWPRGKKLDRLGLARWLVADDNPLTARVAVNRQWQMLFGAGLVRTAEDFGVQGEPPTHPELLDWLAVTFRDSGWDVKRLLRLMVLSQAYRQSSYLTPKLHRLDPDNRLLGRVSRLRLPAEMIRDLALAASGLLVEQLGGPSVRPYQPAGLWQELADTPYNRDNGPALYRRGLYTFWKRTVAPPGLVTFDAAGRETCNVLESRTNTPLQALNLLNDVTYVEAARVLAGRVMQKACTPAERLTFAFRLVLARSPRPEERGVLLAAFNRHLARYRHDQSAAKKLIAAGESVARAGLDPAELAAYTTVASILLNLDEAVTRE